MTLHVHNTAEMLDCYVWQVDYYQMHELSDKYLRGDNTETFSSINTLVRTQTTKPKYCQFEDTNIIRKQASLLKHSRNNHTRNIINANQMMNFQLVYFIKCRNKSEIKVTQHMKYKQKD